MLSNIVIVFYFLIMIAALGAVCGWWPREPDEVIGHGTVLMRRWRLTWRPRGWAHILPAVYLHHLVRADNDLDKHDHPCDNISIVLRRTWLEQLADDTVVARRPGAIVFRRAATPHRIAEVEGGGVWTLWICGPVYRDWGFHCPRGWVSHSEYFERSATAGKKGC